MEAAKKVLDRARGYLTVCRESAEGVLAHPKVTQWDNIDLDANKAIIDAFGLPMGIGSASREYFNLANRILTQIKRDENEIANLETDIRLAAVEKGIADTMAEQIEKSGLRLEQPLTTLLEYKKTLIDADGIFREKLNLANLIPLARSFAGSKTNLFDGGYRILAIITEDEELKDKKKNIYNYFHAAAALKTKLEKTDLSALPPLAAEVVTGHINAAVTAPEEIKNFVNYCSQDFNTQLQAITGIKQKIEAVRGDSINDLFNFLNSTADFLAKTIIDFYFKIHILDELELISATLQDLQIFNHALKNEFLARFLSEIRNNGSPLNPRRMAVETSHKYFGGMKGLWRIVKLIFLCFAGQRMVSYQDLQGKLEEVLSTCPFCRFRQESERKNLKNFIENYIGSYSRPFPHDELYSLFFNTLLIYSAKLEVFFQGFRLKSPLPRDNGEEPGNVQTSTTLGKLTTRIEVRIEAFKKAR